MELGFDGVLLNSSVARSLNPVTMAEAMKLAVISGRKGFESGLIEKRKKCCGEVLLFLEKFLIFNTQID